MIFTITPVNERGESENKEQRRWNRDRLIGAGVEVERMSGGDGTERGET